MDEKYVPNVIKDMEFHKDNKKDKALSAIHYSPELFRGDQNLFVLYKKIENISSALFLITQSVPDTEILKNELRQTSLGSLKTFLAVLVKKPLSVDDFQTISASVFQTASILDIAVWSGIVSHMNAAILQAEIAAIISTLEGLYAKYETSHFIDKTFFGDEMSLIDTSFKTSTPHSIKDNYKGHTKGQEIKDKQVFHSKTDRRGKILELLMSKSEINVKDVALVMPEVSEKTLQRELGALVDEGVVVRQGERRWSTYSRA